tara:strand:- start:173 stop:469 length:297 start_codon:yes stop_codon:yes gene_type:complete
MNSITKARESSNDTNRKKGILTFIKSAVSRGDKLHNDIIDELIKTGYYSIIYEKYVMNDNIPDDEIPIKVFEILQMFSFCLPDELDKHYKGLTVQKLF